MTVKEISLIQPEMFDLPELTQTVLLFFNLGHFKRFHARVDGGGIRNFGPARQFQYNGATAEITVLGGMIGAPLAAIVTEMALAAGAETIYAFGSAGSTGRTALVPGELVIPQIGYDETGMCRDYEDRSDFQTIKPCFDVRPCRAIVTVNSFFRLTPLKVESYRKANIELIDMEAAPLNCIVTRRNKCFSPLFFISDRVSDDYRWENASRSEAAQAGLNAGLDLLCDI